jgi:hypothetical protein
METPRLDSAMIHGILVRRGPNPPGPLATYAALYQAGEVGLPEAVLIDRVRWGDRRSFRQVLHNVSRRVKRITGRQSSGYEVLLVERHDGGKQLALRPEVREVIEADAKLQQFLMLPVEEILAMRNPDNPEGDKSKWPRLA